jgi:hypothetical protein
MLVSIPESSISQNRLISAIPGIDTGIEVFWTSLLITTQMLVCLDFIILDNTC